jgi:hypothetical protein
MSATSVKSTEPRNVSIPEAGIPTSRTATSELRELISPHRRT